MQDNSFAFSKRIQDPIMSQFPLILAIEPKLLPPAVANGFRMDYKVINVRNVWRVLS